MIRRIQETLTSPSSSVIIALAVSQTPELAATDNAPLLGTMPNLVPTSRADFFLWGSGGEIHNRSNYWNFFETPTFM